MTALNNSPTPVPAAAQAVDDAELAKCVQAGDHAAFELLMRRHNRRLYRLARAMLRSSADAEEALQEAYLAAFQAIAGFRAEASLATWLSRIVANECVGRLRRQARRQRIAPIVSAANDASQDEPDQEPASMPSDDIEEPERALGRTQLRSLLERRIEELPDVLRTVFVLRAVEELSVEETARSLEIPEATVRTRHFRARSLLRQALAQDMDLAERDVFSFDGERCDRIVAHVLGRVGRLP